MKRFLRLFRLHRILEADLARLQREVHAEYEGRKSSQRLAETTSRDWRAAAGEVERLEGQLAGWKRTVEQIKRERDLGVRDAEFWRERATKLEAEMAKQYEKRIESVEIVADWQAQRAFGRRIYHQAPALPEAPPDMQPVPKQRIPARILVQRAEAQFADDQRKYIQKLTEQRRAAREAAQAPPAEPQPETQPAA